MLCQKIAVFLFLKSRAADVPHCDVTKQTIASHRHPPGTGEAQTFVNTKFNFSSLYVLTLLFPVAADGSATA